MPAENQRSENGRSLLLEQAINIWKRKWLVLATAWIVCVVGWAVVIVMPQRYESDARAFVDVHGLLAPLLKGLVVDTTGEQIDLQKTILSRPNLEQVVMRANLASAATSDARRELMVDGLASNIKLTTEGKNIFALAYSNSDPVKAKDVLDALLTVFASSTRAEFEKAQAFLSNQIAAYEVELRDAEQRRADFKKKYAAYFDDNGVKQPELLRGALAHIRLDYDEAVARAKSLQEQLAHIPLLLSLASNPTVGDHGQVVYASPEVELAVARRHLAELRLTYTPKHPDVILAKQAVAALEAEVANARKAGTDEGKLEVSNPVYEQLRLKLADTQALIPALKARWDKAVSDYNGAEALGRDLPEIAAKSQDLDRDYDIIKKNYDELVRRREAANLSEAASNQTNRSQVRVIDPPQVPTTPTFPDRLVLFSVVLALGIAAGAAAPVVWAFAKPTFASAAQLRGVGLPVIGTITTVGGVKPAPIFGYAAGQFFVVATGGLLLLYGGLVLSMTGIFKGAW